MLLYVGYSVGNCNLGVRASVDPSVSADTVTDFKKGFQARGRGSINLYDDGERLMGQRVLMYVLDLGTNGSFVFSWW